MQPSTTVPAFGREGIEYSPRRISTRKTAPPSYFVPPAPKSEEKRPVVKKTPTRKAGTTRKRTKSDDPDGAKGCHTMHIRKCMFGDDANDSKAGKGLPPYISSEAARGRLFHSVTNIPLMADKFNEGYNSDTGDNGVEAAWCLRMSEDRLGEVVDMLPIEKYFAVLWNQFIQTHYPMINDRDVFHAYMRFIEMFGAEVKRMKMEIVLVKQVTKDYEMGTIDAKGYMEIMNALKYVDMKNVVRGVPDTEYEWPHRLLRETLPQFQKKQYNGPSGSRRRVRTAALKNWLDEEHRKVDKLDENVKSALRHGKATTELWMTELADKEAELTANLCCIEK